MNSIVCIALLLVSVGTFCPFCESTLTRLPSDKLILLGDSVTLECFTSDKKYTSTWKHQRVGSTTSNDVSLLDRRTDDGSIVAKLVKGYHERYKLFSKPDTGDYSLQITNVQPVDAGIYTCTAQGGIGQDASAKLTVLEISPVCTSNATEVLGDNSCEQEPDNVAFSCRFKVHGSVMPMVTWVSVDHPDEIFKVNTPITDDDGYAISKLIVRGDKSGLNGASFKCILPSPENANSELFTCKTPTIKVVEISNSTEPKTYTTPHEVECETGPNLEMTKCEWVRRNEDDHGETVVVSKKSLLNLHRQDMVAGIYVCIAECNIRGRTVPCKVQAVTIKYQPAGASHDAGLGSSSSSFVIPVAVVIPAIAVIIIIIAVLWICKKFIRRQEAEKSKTRNGEINPLMNRNGVAANGVVQGNNTVSGNISESVSVDIPDAKIGKPGSREERMRLIEERASARMRANAAARLGESNQGFSPDSVNSDVAEGLSADPKKNE